MVESWVECRYIEMKPDQAKRFYKTRSGASPPKGKTPFKNKIDELKACFPEDADIFDQAYVEWTSMSNGSHPSGIGIAQNNLPGEAEKVLGATYRPDMFQDGITGGITAAAFLVYEAGRLSPQGDGWVADLADVMMQAVNLLKPAP